MRRALIATCLVGPCHASADRWEAPFCFHVPLVFESERCNPFFGVGFGRCDNGHAATWLGACEREHTDGHEHSGSTDHTHLWDFEHPPPPHPPPPPPGEDDVGDVGSGDGDFGSGHAAS